MKTNNNQNFSVEDIREIRNEDDKRRSSMNASELSADIRASAEEGRKVMEQLRSTQGAVPQGA